MGRGSLIGIDPKGNIVHYSSIQERFFSKADVKGIDDCWEWKASTVKGIYGKFKCNGITYPAHRFSYIITYGEIPVDKVILHRCNYGLCVNPNHLAIGSHLDNMRHKKESMIERASSESIISAVLDIMDKNPHIWEAQYCSICETLSDIIKRPFGCSRLLRGQS